MITRPKTVAVDREAADWFARLNARTVSVADLEAFRVWRADPVRRAAYERIEAIWRASGSFRSDPEMAALAAEAARPRTGALQRWAAIGAVAAVAIALGVWTWPRAETLTTEPGERRTERLADGSSVSLDTDTVVRVRLKRGLRDLTLVKGQALFEVAHDAGRPFQVEVNGATVIATGTRFGVRLVGEGAKVVLIDGGVTVAEGKGAPGHRWTLSAGQEILTGAGTAPAPRLVRNPEAASSWVNGRLTFDQTPLSIATAEFNRYGGRPIRLAPGVNASTPISGEFDSADEEAFADAVARLYGLALRREAIAIVIVRQPPEEKS